MPTDKHEGLNTCLCLLRKNLNNLAEGIRSAQHMNRRSNTEYCESTSWLRAFITNALPVPGSFKKIACPEQFELCLNACERFKTTGRSPTNQSAVSS